MDMVASLADAVGLTAGDVNMNMKVSVHEDNSGALVLAETLPPQFTPGSKYYATKTIWFCEEIKNGESSFLRLILLNSLVIFSPTVCLSPHLNTFGPKSLVGNYFDIFRFVLVSVQFFMRIQVREGVSI